MIASALLVYPDERFLERREELKSIAKEIGGGAGESLSTFFSDTASLTLDDSQRLYVEIFAMHPRCSLFLTSWTHGDTRNRGIALL